MTLNMQGLSYVTSIEPICRGCSVNTRRHLPNASTHAGKLNERNVEIKRADGQWTYAAEMDGVRKIDSASED